MSQAKAREASKKRITSKLLTGAYKEFRDASRAIRLSCLSTKEQEALLKIATNYFDKTVVKEALKKVRMERKPNAPSAALTDPRFAKPVPIHVQFARLTHNKKLLSNILQFSRTALDAGLTLPELVADLEAV